MSDTSFEPKHKQMGQHIASGILNSGVGQIVKVGCQFLSVIALSRLLPQSEFGLMAMVSPVYAFILLFQDLGLSQATIQKPTIRHDEINAFFWINLALGLLLAVLIVAISPLVGLYYHEPRVVPLVGAMSLFFLIGSAGNQHTALLARKLEFRVQNLIGIIGALSGLVLSIIAAYFLRNYWALYIGMAANIFIPVFGAWLTVQWLPSWPQKVTGLSHSLKFGTGLTIANGLGFIAGNADNVLIGRQWGDVSLGLYDRAYKLLMFPLFRLIGPLSGTLNPIFSRLMGEPDRYRDMFLKIMCQLTLALWPGVLWSIVFSDPLVPTLLGKQWVDATNIFNALAYASFAQIVHSYLGFLFVSQGRSRELVRWNIFNTTACVATYLIGLPFGAIGVAIAFAISEYIRTPIFWWYATRRGPVDLRRSVLSLMPQTVSVFAAAMALLVYREFVHLPVIVFLAGGLLLSYMTTLLAMGLSVAGRETLKYSLFAAKKLMQHGSPVAQNRAI